MSETQKPRRRRFQYSLRSLFLLMFLASLGMSWVAVRIKRAREQKAAVEEIRKLGGVVVCDYELDNSGNELPSARPPGPAWLRDLLGEDFFATVVHVYFNSSWVTDASLVHLTQLTQLQRFDLFSRQVTDSGLYHLKGLTHLQTLGLEDTRVTDAGLEHLKGMTELRSLVLTVPNVTPNGVERLGQALPKCQLSVIYHARPARKREK